MESQAKPVQSHIARLQKFCHKAAVGNWHLGMWTMMARCAGMAVHMDIDMKVGMDIESLRRYTC